MGAILQVTDGLNEGIALGVTEALREGARAVLVLPADLPDALRRRRSTSCWTLPTRRSPQARAGRSWPSRPSDARSGTNALLLSPPDVDRAPRSASTSFEAHLRAAATADATVQVVRDPALGFDLDTPDDLERCSTRRCCRELDATGPGGGRRASARRRRRDVPDRLLAVALPALPEVRPGDDLAGARSSRRGASSSRASPTSRRAASDVLVVTQKVVSKAEGRIVDLTTVEPRPEAVEFAERWDRDARQVEVVLRGVGGGPAHGARRDHLPDPPRLRVRQRRRRCLEPGGDTT